MRVLTYYGLDDRGWPFADARLLQGGVEVHQVDQIKLDAVVLEGRDADEVLDNLADEIDRQADEWIDRNIL